MTKGALILALVAAATGTARPRPEAFGWDRPSCFAYSPADDAYACLAFGLGADDAGTAFRPMDFELWMAPAGTAWSGLKAVSMVGPERTTLLMIAHHEYGPGRAIEHFETTRAAMREAAKMGFKKPVQQIPLPSGQWVEAGHARLRFTTTYHVGDASEYSIGSLQIECRGARDGTSARLVELLADRRGASAVAFVAPAARNIAVGVLHDGGGEGSGWLQTEYLHVDPRRVCRSP
jgi:hypothetical protein